jgi:hypothetical protein
MSLVDELYCYISLANTALCALGGERRNNWQTPLFILSGLIFPAAVKSGAEKRKLDAVHP